MGALAVHVVLKVVIGAVPLPVVVGWVVAVVTAMAVVQLAPLEPVTLLLWWRLVPSAIISWAPVCGVAACSPTVTCPQDPPLSSWSDWCFVAVKGEHLAFCPPESALLEVPSADRSSVVSRC